MNSRLLCTTMICTSVVTIVGMTQLSSCYAEKRRYDLMESMHAEARATADSFARAKKGILTKGDRANGKVQTDQEARYQEEEVKGRRKKVF